MQLPKTASIIVSSSWPLFSEHLYNSTVYRQSSLEHPDN